ncbi:MAG: zinc-binding alcohol dehydrogenase, partial [Pseudomonadota bacterium]
QTRFRVPESSVIPLPADVPAERALLAANAETALNAIWDARIAPGTRCLVVGAGMVGWLVTALLSPRVDLSITLTNVRPQTGVNTDDFGVNFVAPGDVPAGAFDVAFHCSASGAGLQTALDSLDFEGRVIELSWYGDKPVEISLGGNFHANRLSIISSQVGHVSPARRAAYSYRDRLSAALAALKDPRLDALITDDVQFRDLPGALPGLLAPDAPGIATRIVY